MRRVFAVLPAALVLAVVVQFFFAASGAFNTAPNDEAFQPHRALGYLIFALAVLMTIVAALARMPGRFIGRSGLLSPDRPHAYGNCCISDALRVRPVAR